MQSHDNTAKAHIGAESSSDRSSIAKRAWQQAKALPRSEITHFRWSPAFGCLVHPMQASSRWDPTRGDLCARRHARATDFHFEKRGTGTQFFFRPHRGVSGNTEAGWRQWRQTRFGHARSERSRPQFTAHNSVRPFENGLRSLGSSATRPLCTLAPRQFLTGLQQMESFRKHRREMLAFALSVQLCFGYRR